MGFFNRLWHLIVLSSLLRRVRNEVDSLEDVLAMHSSQLNPAIADSAPQNKAATSTTPSSLDDLSTATTYPAPIWSDEISRTSETQHISCNKKWPDLEIFLPVYLNGNVSTDQNGIARVLGDVTQKFERNDEWSNVFLRSFLMFWPVKESKVKFRIILDEELRNSSLVKEHVTDFIDKKSMELGEDFPHIDVTYNPPLEHVYTTGHDRQQYLMFTADKITSSEFVAFVDTDALFHSYADLDDMFEDGKPIIHGKIQYFGGGRTIKRNWAASTYHFLGEEEPMICMSYFPVIIRRVDLNHLREFVEQKFNTTFDNFFYDIQLKQQWARYSQFNILCAFLYWHHRDDYRWYIHDMTPNWNGFVPKPFFGQWGDKSVFAKEMFQQRPYLATHLDGRYHRGGKINDLVIYHFVHAWCYRNPIFRVKLASNLSEVSKTILSKIRGEEGKRICADLKTRNESYNVEMHKFEDANYLYEMACPNFTAIAAIHRARYERIRNCNHTYVFV